MINPTITAYRLLGHFWLTELHPSDLEMLAALPELADTLTTSKAAELDALAVEYQRLFGFNLPPYESVFTDPTAMLMAPATELVQKLYWQAAWQPPQGTRSGAPDHLGLELLALADWLETGQTELAAQLHQAHLALWAPAFVQTLHRLRPHPFYAALADLTVELILSTLPQTTVADDPFPELPPPPVFRDSGGPDTPAPVQAFCPTDDGQCITAPPTEADLRLRDVIKKLLPPCDAGLFITREDIARMAQALRMPASMGDRYKMIETLFQQAGEFDLVPQLLAQFDQLFNRAASGYQAWADAYPDWAGYAAAWQRRTSATQTLLHDLSQIAAMDHD